MANIRVARRSGLVLRGGRNRRDTLWADATETNNGLAAASTAVISNVTGASVLALRPFTVIRTRGYLHLRSDQTANTELYHAAWGMAIISNEAAAVGITAMPTPFTEMGSDLWFVFEQLAGTNVVSSAVGFDAIGGVSRVFDSKGMRKVEDGQEITFVKETSSVSVGVTFLSAARLLLKLH